jgi:hypothetical protein
MNSWSPLWSMLVESSLWEEPYHVRILFVTMLCLKDRDNIVRWDGYKLSKKAHITPVECIEALQILMNPDKRRQAFDGIEAQQYEGRRIEKTGEGWLVLNGEKYREMMKSINRKEYKRDWQEKHRQGKPLPGEPEFDRAVKDGIIDQETGEKIASNEQPHE